MGYIPSIKDFLEEVDPNRTIHRDKAMAEITTVVLVSAVRDTRTLLNSECQEKLEKALNIEKFSFERIYKVFNQAGKKEELFKSIEECLDKVKADYIKTHLEAMPMQKREEVLAKYPALKDLAN